MMVGAMSKKCNRCMTEHRVTPVTQQVSPRALLLALQSGSGSHGDEITGWPSVWLICLRPQISPTLEPEMTGLLREEVINGDKPTLTWKANEGHIPLMSHYTEMAVLNSHQQGI